MEPLSAPQALTAESRAAVSALPELPKSSVRLAGGSWGADESPAGEEPADDPGGCSDEPLGDVSSEAEAAGDEAASVVAGADAGVLAPGVALSDDPQPATTSAATVAAARAAHLVLCNGFMT